MYIEYNANHFTNKQLKDQENKSSEQIIRNVFTVVCVMQRVPLLTFGR